MDHCTDLFIPKINILINLTLHRILLEGVVYSRDEKRQSLTVF